MHPDRPRRCAYRLLLPLWFVLEIPTLLVVIGLLLLGLLGFTAYASINSDFFGLAAPPLGELQFSTGFEYVTAPDERNWTITYEGPENSTFRGVVRHVSHWREETFPFATHDILVTSGEFSSQEKVSVRVVLHTFTYRYYGHKPSGGINLLHIVPASAEIYQQLLQIREWNQVIISGREILRIDRYDPDGQFLGTFQDAGCNSILVTSVVIDRAGTPVP